MYETGQIYRKLAKNLKLMYMYKRLKYINSDKRSKTNVFTVKIIILQTGNLEIA